MITYRDTPFQAHQAKWGETDPVEAFTPIRVRTVLAAYASFALRRLGHYDKAVFIDAGARLGWLSDFFRESPVLYHGFEANPRAVAEAQRRGRAVFDEPRVDAAEIVFCRQVLQYLPDVQSFVSRLERLVAPGGLLCIVQSVPWTLDAPHHYNAADSAESVRACFTLPLEHMAALPDGSPGEIVFLCRRPPCPTK